MKPPTPSELQQYDGPALEPLLERIHKEHGPRVKIVKAERVREGGVLGFFAREMFRLTIDTRSSKTVQSQVASMGQSRVGSQGQKSQGQGGQSPSRATSQTTPATNDATRYSRQGDQIAQRGGRGGGARNTLGSSRTSQNRLSQSNLNSNSINAPTVGAALRSHKTPQPLKGETRSNTTRPTTPSIDNPQPVSASPPVSQTTPSQSINPQPTMPQPSAVSPDNPPVNPASLVLADTLAQNDKLELSAAQQTTDQARQAEDGLTKGALHESTIQEEKTTGPVFADVLAQVASNQTSAGNKETGTSFEPTNDIITGLEVDPGYNDGTYGDIDDDAVNDGFISDAPYDATNYTSFDPEYIEPDYAGNYQEYMGSNDMVVWGNDYGEYPHMGHISSPDHPIVASELLKMGISEQLLGDYDIQMMDGNYEPIKTAGILVDTFAKLPTAPPPPSLPGSLLAIVGDLQRAKKLAAEIATEIGSDPVAIPVVSSRSVAKIDPSLTARSALEVSERAPGWRRNGSATVVVVVSPLVGGNRSWAKLVLAAMKPTAVWGMAEALYKTEEITAWAEAIGGVDALILTEVRHSVSPATATATGIPIARLDENRASPERWATVVGDLLNQAFAPRQRNRAG